MSAAHSLEDRQRCKRGEAGVALPTVEGEIAGLFPVPGGAGGLQYLAALRGTPGGLATPWTTLVEPVARAVAARAVFTLVPEAPDKLASASLRV